MQFHVKSQCFVLLIGGKTVYKCLCAGPFDIDVILMPVSS